MTVILEYFEYIDCPSIFKIGGFINLLLLPYIAYLSIYCNYHVQINTDLNEMIEGFSAKLYSNARHCVYALDNDNF